MMRLGLWIGLLGVGLAVARAEEPAAAPKVWDRDVALGLSVTSGNSDTVLLTAGVHAHGTWPDDDWLLGLDGAYGKSDGDVSNEKLQGKAQYKHLIDTRWYVTGVVDGLHDGVAALAYRLSLGPGVGYYFIRSERTTLSADLGPSYVLEKFNGESVDDYWALRVGERFERQLSETAKVWQALEYLPAVDDFQNYKLNAEVGLEAAMTEALSLRVVGRNEYNNRPASGRKHNDISLISAVAYKF